jgi:hypothetical protein
MSGPIDQPFTALLDLEPATLQRQPPPQSQAIEFSFTCAKTTWNSHEPASILHHLVFLTELLQVVAIPHRPRNRHDRQGLPLEQYCTGLGAVR